MSKRDRRPVVVYPNNFVLGSTSRVIPAGTVVRTPDAPRCLDFDGYNTLSLALALAGLSSGDTFRVYVAASDPESATAEPVIDHLSEVLAITATGDGIYAATVNLVKILHGGAGGVQSAIPFSAGSVSPAWGHPGQANFVDGWNNTGGYNAFSRGINYGGVLSSSIHLQALTDPGVRTGFKVVLSMRSNMNDTTSEMNIVVSRPGHPALTSRFYGNPGYVGALPPVSGGLVTNAFVDYTLAIDPAQAAFIDFTEDLGVTIEYGGIVFDSPPPWLTWDFKSLRFECPGAGHGGVTAIAIPFYRNLILFDATDCAHDVTVSKMYSTLTNARRGGRNGL